MGNQKCKQIKMAGPKLGNQIEGCLRLSQQIHWPTDRGLGKCNQRSDKVQNENQVYILYTLRINKKTMHGSGAQEYKWRINSWGE